MFTSFPFPEIGGGETTGSTLTSTSGFQAFILQCADRRCRRRLGSWICSLPAAFSAVFLALSCVLIVLPPFFSWWPGQPRLGDAGGTFGGDGQVQLGGH